MFDKIIGNNAVKEVLRRLLAQKRVPNALLFAGADGVGKKQFAIQLAKAFVCLNPVNSEACDICANCRRADQFTFPKSDKNEDYEKVIFSEHSDIGMVVPYKNSILIKAIRELEKEANFRPFEATARFFLIDNAEKLSIAKDNAANALLKTLEEPPAASHIFLITSRPDALLPTIRSRCQTLLFAPIATGEIENYLSTTKKLTPQDSALLARLASGRLGHALGADLEKFRANRQAMLKVLESILIKEDRGELLRIGEEMNDAKNKDNFETRLDILQTLIHDVWAIRNEANAKITVNVDLEIDLKKLAARADSQRLAAWLSEIETLREGLAVNLNRKIAIDALFMQMAG